MIEHRNAVNFVFWAREDFDTQVLARTLASTSLNFDLAVYECLVPLAAGTTIEIAGDALELLTRRADVTLINTVPSAMEALVRAGAVPGETRSVNLAGEALKRALVDRIFATTDVATVRNLYGPSETTTYSTWVTMTRSEGFISHIGRPIANTQVYILDEYGQPVPVGVAGEIHIGGAGVARGYLNRPELTAQRFVADPLARIPMRGCTRPATWGGGTGWEHRVSGPQRFSGEGPWLSDRVGGDRGRLAACPGVREAVVLAREDSPGASGW